MTQTHNTSYTPVRSDATPRVRFDDQAKSLGQAPAPRPRGLCTAWPQCPHTKHISSLAAAAATSTTATGSPRAISHVGCGALHPSLRTWRTNPSLRTIRSQHSAHRTRCAHILSPPRHTLSRARRLTRVTLPRSSHLLPPGTCAVPVNDHPNPHAACHIITPFPVSSSISGGGTVVPYRLHRR